MKFIFEINHPKHYYQFKPIIQKLKKEDHKVYVFAYKKDIVLTLLDEEKIHYEVIGENKKGLFNKIINTIPVFFKYFRHINTIKPDKLISKASFLSVFIAKLLGRPSIIFPDSEVVLLTNKIVAPLASKIVTPESFALDYGKSHKRVNGFFEECYLAPDVFKPNMNIQKLLQIKDDEQYVIVRFVGWNANHDVSHKGLSNEEKIKLVLDLAKYAKVFITSESVLPKVLEKYKLTIPKNQIHSALYNAAMYIGDSQTMATEAALLGTPALRYNSFVGSNDMSNFVILEEKYKLLKNYNNFAALYDNAILFAQDKTLKMEWRKKADKFFSKKESINNEIFNIIIKNNN